MFTTHHIIDNQQATVAEHLRRHLADADAFNLVSAYFSIYGYELLMDELDSIGEVRFLFGDPTSVDDLDPGDKDPKSFAVTEKGLTPNHTMTQKYLAKRCADWVRSKSVAIRSISQANFLHGKMYLTGSAGELSSAVVGSSNFTKSGLGGSARSNLEINLTVSDADTLSELQEWFNLLWKDTQRTQDVKQKVLDALARVGRDHAPEVVYFKTLYDLFRKEMEARQADDEGLSATGFYDSQIWNALYEFQKDGSKGIIAKLRQHNGCILADSVGLGKTYTALAVIKYFEQRNERVLVLCPRKLYENWSLYQASSGHIQNPFPQDRFSYTLLAHTDLSRPTGRSGNVDLANFNWSNYDFVVIDESHNFRKSDGQRYQKLLNDIIAAGTRTKILMLSATPVNTSLIDLRNQIYLITEGQEDSYRERLGVRNIRNTMAAAQRQFKEWESKTRKGIRDKSVLMENLGADFLRLLGGISIARSRRHIEQSYAAEMERIGKFPTHAPPVNYYPPTDLNGRLSYKELADSIGKFKLAVYQPSNYVTDPIRLEELEQRRITQNFNQRDSERFLVGMMRTNFLKRLESSAHSLKLTLQRTISKIDGLIEKIERFQTMTHNASELESTDVMPDDDEDDEEFLVNKGRSPYRLSELDLARWLTDLHEDRATLTTVLDEVIAITPERDGKLRHIKAAIHQKTTCPTTTNDGTPNRKMLVFTTFKDTALYLYNNLHNLTKELGVEMAMAAGDETHTTAGRNTFNAILTNFAPTARGRKMDSSDPNIDILIATDCISEGQNLQDCDTVLNYDIHWNPVRLIQRFGRIDRIGSRNPSVHMHNYWPTKDMDIYLRLENRVHARMALADIAATGDEDPLTDEDARQELRFRDQQLLKLQEEIFDMDELADSPVMSDFTLDHFLAQLLRYLEKNRDTLEALPGGIYAVVEDNAPTIQTGAIFLLRQQNTTHGSPRRSAASPVHPHYIVYIQDNGTIRFGCANARQALSVFEAAAVGNTEPIMQLCDRFDRLTNFGGTMSHYDGLINSVIAHIRQAHSDTQSRSLQPGGARDFQFTPASETPRSANDFELVTWLVIMGK